MKNISGIEGIFEENVLYSESYGSEYHGLDQVKKWFANWCIHATVLEWNVKQFISQDKVTVAEWYFECNSPYTKVQDSAVLNKKV